MPQRDAVTGTTGSGMAREIYACAGVKCDGAQGSAHTYDYSYGKVNPNGK
jgi:hypothetical protein